MSRNAATVSKGAVANMDLTGERYTDVTTAGPAAGAVTAGAVTAGAVTAGAVTAGAVTAGAVTAGAVTAGAVTAGAVTAGAVTAGAEPAGTLRPASGTGWDTFPARTAGRLAARPAAVPEPGVIPLAGMRRLVARRMHESLQAMAQVTLTTEADVTSLVDLHGALRQRFAPTYTDLVVRAVALALRDHPRLNATIEGEHIRLLRRVHIGVAVALKDGLIVPVVRDADRGDLEYVARATRDLVRRATRGALTPADTSGGTFTVTNLGRYGVDAFTPIVNPPEAATLGTGRISDRPRRRGDGLVWRQVMTLSLTFDHRLVDGVPAAAFLHDVRQRLEHPDALAA